METQEDSLEGCWWTAANSSYSCWQRCLPSSQWPSFWRHWPQFTGVCPGTCVTSQVYFSHMTKGSHMTQYGSVRSFSWKLGQWIQRPVAELYDQLWEKQEKEGTEGRGSNTQGSSRWQPCLSLEQGYHCIFKIKPSIFMCCYSRFPSPETGRLLNDPLNNKWCFLSSSDMVRGYDYSSMVQQNFLPRWNGPPNLRCAVATWG